MKKEDENEWREWEAVELGVWMVWEEFRLRGSMVYSSDVYLLEWSAC